jgi:PAT family beta-lactamase induction signal transducer AmpG
MFKFLYFIITIITKKSPGTITMINVTSKNPLKYFLFGSLYSAEGIQIGIAMVLVPIYLLSLDFRPEIVTLIIGIIMVPWILKFLFGWIVDHYSYIGRKKIILLGGTLSGITLILASIINPSTMLIPFILIFFIGQCGIGFLDISADAWAIDISTKQERGKISAFMAIGLYSGMALSSSILGTLAENINYNTAFLMGGIAILLIMLIPFFLKEQTIPEKTKKIISKLFVDFRKSAFLLFSVFLAIIFLSSGILELAVPLFMEIRLGLNIAMIGYISSIFFIGRAIGSFLCGVLSDIWNRLKILTIIIIANIILSALLITVNSPQQLIPIYGVIGFLNGGLLAILIAVSMDRTNPTIAATQFAIFMCLINTGELIGTTISGTLYALLEFTGVFLIAAWLLGPPLLLLYFIQKQN